MKQEFDALELSAEQRLKALLCAYVLGELEGEERAIVEAELAKSESLRAERARLEATIGVVSGALHDGSRGELSPSASSALDAAVARKLPRSWHQNAWIRAAAAAVVIAGGTLILREIKRDDMLVHQNVGKNSSGEGDLLVAVAPASAPQSKLGKTAPAASEPSGANSETALEDFEVEVAQGASTSAPEPDPSAPKDLATNPTTTSSTELFLGGGKKEEVVGADFDDPKATWEAKQQADEQAVKFAELEKLRRLSGEVRDSLDVPADSKSRGDETRKSDSAPVGGAPAETAKSEPVLGLELQRLEAKEKRAGGKLGMPATPGATSPSTPGTGGPSSPGPLGPGSIALGASKAGGTAAGGPGAAGPAPSASTRGASTNGRPGGGYFADESNAAEPTELNEEELSVLRELGYSDGSDDDSDVRRRSLETRQQLSKAAFDQRRFQALQRSCFALPNESPRDMFFRFWGDNPFELTALDRHSTFSADVDTASYALARRFLVEGHLPTKAQVRTEEFVNYFKGDVPPPSEGTFRVAMELAPSLFGETSDMWMLRVAVRGREVSKRERMPLALNFVIDVSGSMKEQNRLELVKHALRMLVGQLDARDTISIVKFSNDAALVLPPTSAKHRDLIEAAIHPLQPEGSTNTEAGLRMGYAQASAALTKGSNNRVVLLTDGVANVGITDPNSLVSMVEMSRKQGVLLNTVGVGMNNHNDNLLEQLANKGDGICNYVDDDAEVRRALVDNFTGAFEAIARDVKIQVEFDPAQVERYRLLGYENRAVADADFRNAKVDAGEVGAGHQVVALYEIVRRGGASADGPLATARVRWKAPYAQGVADSESNANETEIAEPFTARQAVGGYGQASAGYRRSVLVAQFAEFLRRSVHARTDSLDRMISEAEVLAAAMNDAEFSEFVALAKQSHALVIAETRRRDWFDDYADLLRHNRYLCQQIEDLRGRSDGARRIDELDASLRNLEQRLDLLRRRVEGAQDVLTREHVDQLAAENIVLQRRLLELLDQVARTDR